MTWKDKLEIGLKDDAAFRRDNLPEFQKNPVGRKKKAGDETRSREEPGARQVAAAQAGPHEEAPGPRRRASRPARAERPRPARKRTA